MSTAIVVGAFVGIILAHVFDVIRRWQDSKAAAAERAEERRKDQEMREARRWREAQLGATYHPDMDLYLGPSKRWME